MKFINTNIEHLISSKNEIIYCTDTEFMIGNSFQIAINKETKLINIDFGQ